MYVHTYKLSEDIQTLSIANYLIPRATSKLIYTYICMYVCQKKCFKELLHVYIQLHVHVPVLQAVEQNSTPREPNTVNVEMKIVPGSEPPTKCSKHYYVHSFSQIQRKALLCMYIHKLELGFSKNYQLRNNLNFHIQCLTTSVLAIGQVCLLYRVYIFQ